MFLDRLDHYKRKFEEEKKRQLEKEKQEKERCEKEKRQRLNNAHKEEVDDDDADDEEDDEEVTNINEDTKSKGMIPQSLLVAKWLIPAIHGTITNAPNTSNHHLRELLRPYANDYALTNTLLTTARSRAKDMIFGVATRNCQYILALKDELELHGNFVEVLIFNRKKAIDRLMLVVINEEVRKRKAAGTSATALGTSYGAMAIINQWKTTNADFIVEHFGTLDSNW